MWIYGNNVKGFILNLSTNEVMEINAIENPEQLLWLLIDAKQNKNKVLSDREFLNQFNICH